MMKVLDEQFLEISNVMSLLKDFEILYKYDGLREENKYTVICKKHIKITKETDYPLQYLLENLKFPVNFDLIRIQTELECMPNMAKNDYVLEFGDIHLAIVYNKEKKVDKYSVTIAYVCEDNRQSTDYPEEYMLTTYSFFSKSFIDFLNEMVIFSKEKYGDDIVVFILIKDSVLKWSVTSSIQELYRFEDTLENLRKYVGGE